MDHSLGKISSTKLCEHGLDQSDDMASIVPILRKSLERRTNQ